MLGSAGVDSGDHNPAGHSSAGEDFGAPSPPDRDHPTARQPIRATRIEIVVPVHNEQAVLDRSIRRLHHFLCMNMPFTWRVVIADNASTDATPEIAATLARRLSNVDVIRVPLKGRGRALRAAHG
jgi:cellulose synthase/poly-beta-1,6-N-acetylglucosamine synthase-like glycosyltransferase